ncbi:MAG: rod shape-determining protein MreD [Rhodospirillales bacterium]|nr:rod shape-determining protein MreD [Rhodospirillales bacterium]
MRPTTWQRMDVLARRLTPFGLTLVMVFIAILPLHVPGFARVAPLLPLLAVYHWGIFRPELLPVYAVFFIGLLQDVLTGAPVGINAVVLLGVYAVVLYQQKFFAGKSFAVVWLGFTLVSAGAAVLSWCLFSAYYATLINPGALFFQYLLTVGLYPFFGWLFLRWQQAFLKYD